MQAIRVSRKDAGLRTSTCDRAALAMPRRHTVTVRAAAQSPNTNERRQVLGGLLAGLALTGLSSRAQAIDLRDERNNSKMKGYELIYEAREIELPQEVRDGLKQARTDPAETKARVKDSESRIDNKLPTFISKAYWTDAREELRLQLGTLRFDLGVLGEGLGKDKKKEVIGLKKSFFAAADKLDFAIRQKNKESATAELSNVRSELDKVLAKVL